MLIFIDLETTGLSPHIHGVASIGMITETNEEFYQEFRIHPKQQISQEALQINGFSEAELRSYEKPHIVEVSAKITEWINQFDNAQLAGWNVGFDRLFMHEYVMIYHHPVMHYHWLDIASYFQIQYGRYYGLHYACEILNITPEPEIHNALTGAKKVREVYYELISNG